jgi:hypothetical protein
MAIAMADGTRTKLAALSWDAVELGVALLPETVDRDVTVPKWIPFDDGKELAGMLLRLLLLLLLVTLELGLELEVVADGVVEATVNWMLLRLLLLLLLLVTLEPGLELEVFADGVVERLLLLLVTLEPELELEVVADGVVEATVNWCPAKEVTEPRAPELAKVIAGPPELVITV